MIKTMNFTFTHDDIERFSSAEDLRSFCEDFGLDGLELMPISDREDPKYGRNIVKNEMIHGIHLNCIGNWMGKDQSDLIKHYRKDLDYAHEIGAKYVVFHITQVDNEESFTYQMKHSDKEVLDAVIVLINEFLNGQPYEFDFLMENLWWPGLTLRNPDMTKYLLDGVHYKKKGLMLDTGHYLHTNLDISAQEQGLEELHKMLDAHEDLLPYFKGIHLNQSLTGDYVKSVIANPPVIATDPTEAFCQIFEHIFKLDLHEPFDTPGIDAFVKRADPDYLTFEYITGSKNQLIDYLKRGTKYF